MIHLVDTRNAPFEFAHSRLRIGAEEFEFRTREQNLRDKIQVRDLRKAGIRGCEDEEEEGRGGGGRGRELVSQARAIIAQFAWLTSAIASGAFAGEIGLAWQ